VGLLHSVLIQSLLMPNKPKIYESPDGGKTVFEREFNSPHSSRKLTTGEKLYGYHPQELLTKKILPPDVFYKLFRSEKIS